MQKVSDYTIPKAVDYENLSAKAKKALDPTGWWLQPKYDGCALYIKIGPGGLVSDQWVLSASGKQVASCFHIAHEMSQYGPGEYCGEVWHPDMDFQEISGAFRRGYAQPQLQFMLFDACPRGMEGYTYVARVENLPIVHTRQFYSWEHAWSWARTAQADGGKDGAILRNPEAFWEPGRSKGDIIKLKPLQDYDVEVVGFEKDVGAKTGRATVALIFRWKNGTTHKVATGLNHEQQAAPEQFVGKIIRVKCMGLTSAGNMREPRFDGVRDDKLKADY